VVYRLESDSQEINVTEADRWKTERFDSMYRRVLANVLWLLLKYSGAPAYDIPKEEIEDSLVDLEATFRYIVRTQQVNLRAEVRILNAKMDSLTEMVIQQQVVLEGISAVLGMDSVPTEEA
jgi:hypothetical protein